MTNDEINKFLRLEREYRKRYPIQDGEQDEIGILVGRKGYDEALRILELARGRRILLKAPDERMIDGFDYYFDEK